MEGHATPTACQLSVEGVTSEFGGLRALDDVSFDVASRSITALIGPNGAGKTTLFSVITGFVRASAGRVTLYDSDITRWSPDRIARAGIGRTFQSIRLFQNLNVLENVVAARYGCTNSTLLESVLFAPRYKREKSASIKFANELLADLGISHQRTFMPRELPYGDQRRVEIARALASEPKLLMLDEPSAGMGYKEAEDLMDLIVRLNQQGLGILLIEHNMRLVMSIAWKVIVLNFGVKLAEGPPREIQADRAVLEAYLGEEP